MLVQSNNELQDFGEPTKELDPIHEKIINEQIHTGNVKSSYWQLYSFATKRKWILMGIGLIFAIAAGAKITEEELIWITLIILYYSSIARKIRENYLRAVLGQNVAYFDKIGADKPPHLAQFVTAFAIAFSKSWKMTLVICGVFPLIAINEETFSTIRTAIAFSQQKNLSKNYDAKLEMVKSIGVKASGLNGLCVGTIKFFIYSTYALVFWYGSTLIISGEITPGTVVNVFWQIPPIDIESKEGIELENIECRIQLKNISFIYPSRSEIKTLKNVSLDIEPSTTVALVGSSGSGKSTIVSLILRFYDPVEGEILVDGHDIKRFNLKWTRRQMNLVSQKPPVLFNTSIAENEEKNSALRSQELLLKIKILLLDEATSALDSQSEGIVQDALDTTVIIAHRLSTIRNATKIVVMSNGEIIETGTHDELIQDQEGPYSRLIAAQKFEEISNKVINTFAKPVDELQKDATFWSLMFLVVAALAMVAMLRKDISFFDEENNNSGSLTSALSTNATEISGLAGATLGTILQNHCHSHIGKYIVALIIGWKLALLSMISISFLMLGGFYQIKMMSGFEAKTLKAHERSAQVACEGTANIRTVASLTRENNVLKLYSQLLDEPPKEGYINVIFGSMTFALTSCTNYLAEAMVFWYVATLVYKFSCKKN
ncbi:14934_t:CDS:10 [Funneliformis geosporum]|nr:14934_t:CDS:10 [Funneliformis geosporum]